jgi:hypothetical protein
MFGPAEGLNFVVESLQATATTKSRYQRLWGSRAKQAVSETQFAQQLAQIHLTATKILRQLENVTSHWQRNTQMVPQAEWRRHWILHESIPTGFFNDKNCELLEPALSFPNIGEYHLIGLGHTAAMILHLLHCDILKSLPSTPATTGKAIDGNSVVGGAPATTSAAVAKSFKGHRASLIAHAWRVIQTIPYAAQRDIFAIAPVCFTPSFLVARATLLRECDMLKTEDGAEAKLEVCERLKDLIDRHIEWVTKQKIAVAMDLDASWPRSAK